MSRRRKAKRKNQAKPKNRIAISSDGTIARAPKARVRLPAIFQILDEVISAADVAINDATFPDQPFGVFQYGVFQRAFNSMKAIRVLAEHSHWEGATGLSRQLMELVLSMEFMFLRTEDPEAEAIRFLRYGLLQQALYLRSRSRYEKRIGGTTPDLAGHADDSYLAKEYAEFRSGSHGDGSIRWVTSWCGKTSYKLAQESPNPGRVDQYELLYRAWSEQVHAAPGALMTSVFPADGPDWYIKMLHLDDQRIAETIGNSVILFCELWLILPTMRPSFAEEKAQGWLHRLQKAQVGAWEETGTNRENDQPV